MMAELEAPPEETEYAYGCAFCPFATDFYEDIETHECEAHADEMSDV